MARLSWRTKSNWAGRPVWVSTRLVLSHCLLMCLLICGAVSLWSTPMCPPYAESAGEVENLISPKTKHPSLSHFRVWWQRWIISWQVHSQMKVDWLHSLAAFRRRRRATMHFKGFLILLNLRRIRYIVAPAGMKSSRLNCVTAQRGPVLSIHAHAAVAEITWAEWGLGGDYLKTGPAVSDQVTSPAHSAEVNALYLGL